jgi:hypothetical protein
MAFDIFESHTILGSKQKRRFRMHDSFMLCSKNKILLLLLLLILRQATCHMSIAPNIESPVRVIRIAKSVRQLLTDMVCQEKRREVRETERDIWQEEKKLIKILLSI